MTESLNQTPGQRIAQEYYSTPELTMKRLAGLIDAELSARHAASDRVAEELRGIIPSLLAWDPSLEGSESFLRLKALAGGVCSETPDMAAHAPEQTDRGGRPALSSGGAAATERPDDRREAFERE